MKRLVSWIYAPAFLAGFVGWSLWLIQAGQAQWLLGTAFYRDGYRMGPGDLGIGSRPDFPVAYGAQLRDPFMRAQLAKEPPLPDDLR